MNSPYFNYGKKKKRRFGDSPNVVGYEAKIPVYHGGGNTMNFQTGKEYLPNIIKDTGKVMPDGMTSNAWLTQSKGLGKSFGTKSVYNIPTNPGTGNNVVQQPAPSYGPPKVTGSRMGFGKKLSTSFGGSVITLEPSGVVTVSTGKN